MKGENLSQTSLQQNHGTNDPFRKPQSLRPQQKMPVVLGAIDDINSQAKNARALPTERPAKGPQKTPTTAP